MPSRAYYDTEIQDSMADKAKADKEAARESEELAAGLKTSLQNLQ